jgi:hypothetical protein
MNEIDKMNFLIKKGWTCNFETGEVFNTRGKVSKNKCSEGYLRIRFDYDKKQYSIKAHRFIWFCYYNTIPETIDHIDRDRANNKIINLRACTIQENCFNTDAKGYIYRKSRNKFHATIMIDGKSKHVGMFDNEDDAHKAYLEAKLKYHQIKNPIL